MDPILTKHVREPNAFTLDFYLQHEGYDGLKLALAKTPDEIIELVKAMVAYRTITVMKHSATDARRLADLRYRGGATSYLEVLDSDSRLFSAELGLADAQLS